RCLLDVQSGITGAVWLNRAGRRRIQPVNAGFFVADGSRRRRVCVLVVVPAADVVLTVSVPVSRWIPRRRAERRKRLERLSFTCFALPARMSTPLKRATTVSAVARARLAAETVSVPLAWQSATQPSATDAWLPLAAGG